MMVTPAAPQGFDPSLYPGVDPARIAVIRTSDRGAFRGCRRKWNWSSHLRNNLTTMETFSPLWLGTGVHFGLEDYHGWQHFGKKPADAFVAFREAWQATPNLQLPDNWKEDEELATNMLNYYADEWLRTRDPLQTYWHEGHPQCEVDFEIPIPLENHRLYDLILYRGTFDRISIDEYGRLWIVEYKTAKQFEVYHFETDAQITAYCWAAQQVYGLPVEGVVYQQHHKSIVKDPEFLSSSGRYSNRKNQRTTYQRFRKCLENLYGSIEKAPRPSIDAMEDIGLKESADFDLYIRRDKARRNSFQIEAEGQKILMECQEMLNPELPLYPSPTRMCSFCGFELPCILFDSGGDWEEALRNETVQRDKDYDSWRKHLILPQAA